MFMLRNTEKRGLPHIHLIYWLQKDDKVRDPDSVNKNIHAEIPQTKDPILFQIVKKNMVHGPCGKQYNMKSPCMEGMKCTKDYPKNEVTQTVFTDKGGNLYRRRPGTTLDLAMASKGGQLTPIDNKWI